MPTSFEPHKSAAIAPRFFCCRLRQNKRPVDFHMARCRMNAGGFGGWVSWIGGWGKRCMKAKRVADEEGDGEKVGRNVLCMYVLTHLPFTFCLAVWSCCECSRRTGEEPDSGQQNSTPARVFTCPPPFLCCPPSCWPAAMNTHFLCSSGSRVEAMGLK